MNQPYPWSRDSVVENAPRRAGVYGLYSALWIYVGEAEDVRKRLMEHCNGDNSCITKCAPNHFVFELIDNRTARERRCRELVRQHGPLCNIKQASEAAAGGKKVTEN
jgi:excinuclease UvrABC nuclease subunit